MSLHTQYRGATVIPGATCFDTKAIVTVEEGYNYGVSIEYTRIGDYKLGELATSGEQQQRITLSLSHGLEYSGNHYHSLTSEHRSTIHYRTDFLDTNIFNSDWESSTGSTTGVSGLAVTQEGGEHLRHMILGKYNDLPDVIVRTTFTRSATNTSARAFSQVFRYTDENNYMFIRYDNNPSGSIILGDITWDGSTAMETRIATVTGISVVNTAPYYMYTVVNNAMVRHYGSTNGWNFTEHIKVDNLYGSSWQPTVTKFANTTGRVGFLTLGSSNGSFYVPEFQVDSLSDQYTYDTAIRHIGTASGVFGVSIHSSFSNMTDMLPSSGSSWTISSESAIRRNQSNGASWDTLMTSGATFENFVAICYPVAESSRAVGMLFGNTSAFYSLWVTPGRAGGAMETYDSGQHGKIVLGHTVADNNVPFEFKMAKQGVRISWYVNGLLMGTEYGVTSGDLLNAAGRIGVMTWGQTSLGITATFNRLHISALDYPVETFVIEGNKSPHDTLDRFLPKGFALNATAAGFNVVEVGSSRVTFIVNATMRNPALLERYIQDPSYVSIRGEKYSSNLQSGISRTITRADDSYIASSNDINIDSTANAVDLATENMRALNLDTFEASVEINAIPTLENFDRVSIVDSTIGSSAIYLVDGINKRYSADGSFYEVLQLTKNGN